MRAFVLAFIVVSSIGCGTPEGHGGDGGIGITQDLSAVVTPADLAPPAKMCSMTDNLGDGQACAMGCMPGQFPVTLNGSCKCLAGCNTQMQASCPCDRFCTSESVPDAGFQGVCLPGNGPGERCGTDAGGKPFGNGICHQGLACYAPDATSPKYCMYICFGSNNSCPLQTECDPVPPPMPFNVCNILHAPNPVALGGACTPGTDVCVAGALCDGTNCKTQCDGPNATCAGGLTCTAITDRTFTVGYVCK